MGKLIDFFKRKNKTSIEIEDNEDNKENEEKYEIRIQGNINLFDEEERKILQGANELLKLGKATDMVEAIKVFGTMFRGLRCTKDIEYTDDGKVIITFVETARQSDNIETKSLSTNQDQNKDDFYR